jgi:Tol biopolymer transport system component
MRPEPRHLIVALLGAALLSGCIFWPPFGLPGTEQSVIVENRSDDELVLRFADADLYPFAYAVPASTTGEALLYGAGGSTSVELLDRDCKAIADLTLEGPLEHLIIDADHGLGTSDAPPEPERQLVEYFECDQVGADPVLDDGGLAVDVTGRLVVSGGADGDIWAVAVPEGDLEQLTSGMDFDSIGDVAADGSIVFTRYGSAEVTGTLWLLEAGAAEPHQLREHGSIATWSPDGTRVAVIDDDPFGGGLVIVELGDGTEIYVTSDVVTGAAWEPSGERIAFLTSDPSADPFDPIGDSRLMLAVPGDAPTELAAISGFGSLAWSPDGSRIAVETFAGSGSGVTVLDADSGDELFVIDAGSAVTAAPRWSPDGDRLAFMRSDGFDLSTTVMSVAADGGDPIELGDLGLLSASGPLAWSPDGSHLAVAGSGMTVAGEVWLVPAVGGDPVRLMTGATTILGWVE